jgi:hypothetical protein
MANLSILPSKDPSVNLRRLDPQISARGVIVDSMSTLTCGALGTDKTLEPSNLQAAVTFNA